MCSRMREAGDQGTAMSWLGWNSARQEVWSAGLESDLPEEELWAGFAKIITCWERIVSKGKGVLWAPGEDIVCQLQKKRLQLLSCCWQPHVCWDVKLHAVYTNNRSIVCLKNSFGYCGIHSCWVFLSVLEDKTNNATYNVNHWAARRELSAFLCDKGLYFSFSSLQQRESDFFCTGRSPRHRCTIAAFWRNLEFENLWFL